MLDKLGRHRTACRRPSRLRTGVLARPSALQRNSAARTSRPTPTMSAPSRCWLPDYRFITDRNLVLTSPALFWPVHAGQCHQTKHAELLQGDPCHLVVVGFETSGRLREVAEIVEVCAGARSLEAPPSSEPSSTPGMATPLDVNAGSLL